MGTRNVSGKLEIAINDSSLIIILSVLDSRSSESSLAWWSHSAFSCTIQYNLHLLRAWIKHSLTERTHNRVLTSRTVLRKQFKV